MNKPEYSEMVLFGISLGELWRELTFSGVKGGLRQVPMGGTGMVSFELHGAKCMVINARHVKMVEALDHSAKTGASSESVSELLNHRNWKNLAENLATPVLLKVNTKGNKHDDRIFLEAVTSELYTRFGGWRPAKKASTFNRSTWEVESRTPDEDDPKCSMQANNFEQAVLRRLMT